MVEHGKMKMDDQYTWIEKRTAFISWRRPAYVSEEEVQSLIREVIRSTRRMQSV
jgi:hypothetical protein